MPKPLKIVITIIILAFIVWVIASKGERPVVSSVIKVGVPIPLTGTRADVGEYVKNALTLATEKINESPNLVKLEFIYEDTKYDAPTAVSAVQKLINLDHVKYLIGPGGSSEALAVAPVAEQSRTILVVPGAQSDELSKAGDYIFRTIYSTSQEVPIFGPFVAERMKSDTIHFLALNTAISDPYIKAITPIMTAQGKKVGLIEKFDPKDANFIAQLTKIKSQSPTDIFMISTPKQAGIILKEAHELGIEAQYYNIGVESPELFTVAGNLADGLLYPYSFDGMTGDESQVSFRKEYLNRFGKDPDTVAANAYDAAMLISYCIHEKSDDVELVKACLYGIKDYDGVSGKFSMDENGDAKKDIFIKIVKDGKFVRYTE